MRLRNSGFAARKNVGFVNSLKAAGLDRKVNRVLKNGSGLDKREHVSCSADETSAIVRQ